MKTTSYIRHKQTTELFNMANNFFNLIYQRLDSAEEYYPNFQNWYQTKVIHDVLSGKRELIFEEINDKTVGLSLIKFEEKKLCTLKVFEEYQNKGYGLKLFEKSFEKLGTEKPFLTVSEEKYEEFKKIFDYYNFKLTSIKLGIYRENKLEYFFNEN